MRKWFRRLVGVGLTLIVVGGVFSWAVNGVLQEYKASKEISYTITSFSQPPKYDPGDSGFLAAAQRIGWFVDVPSFDGRQLSLYLGDNGDPRRPPTVDAGHPITYYEETTGVHDPDAYVDLTPSRARNIATNRLLLLITIGGAGAGLLMLLVGAVGHILTRHRPE